jgi:hypothetical protein
VPTTAPSGSPTTAKPPDGSTVKNNNSLPTVDPSKGSSEKLIDVSNTVEQKYKDFVPQPISSKAFIVHHTAGRGQWQGVVATFKQRGYPTQYIIDRDAKAYRVIPAGYGAQHMLPGLPPAGVGLNNRNTEGVEVIANNNDDVTPEQVKAGRGLISALGYARNQVFGHGEVNPGSKQTTEGADIAYSYRTGQEVHFVENKTSNHNLIAMSRRSSADNKTENTIVVPIETNKTQNNVIPRDKKAA